MKSIRVVTLSALVLGGTLFTFAASQPRVRKTEPLDLSGAKRAMQQGKGGGRTRNDAVIRANAYRSQTSAEESQALRNEPGAAHPKWSDPAFHK